MFNPIIVFMAAVLTFFVIPCFMSPGILFPNTPKICSPSGTSLGGLFGFSVDLVAADGYMWLAVGEPWLQSVHIYYSELTSISKAAGGVTCVSASLSTDSKVSLLGNGTYGVTSDPLRVLRSVTTVNATSLCGQANWLFVTTISIPRPSSLPLPLFGFTISLSLDAEYIAIGAPGAGPIVNIPALASNFGKVYIFRRTGTVFIKHSTLDATAAGLTPLSKDRFGSRVSYARPGSYYMANSTQSTGNLHMLFVVSNGGWDGVSAPGVARPDGGSPLYGVDSVAGYWPAQPTKSIRNNGIFFFTNERHPEEKTQAASTDWKFVQFLQSSTNEPFGMLGIEISTVLDNKGYPVLVARDQNDNSSSVAVYQYNSTSGRMGKDAVLISPLGSGSAGQDWFGAGIAISIVSDGTLALHAGSPRLSNPVVRFINLSPFWVPDTGKISSPEGSTQFGRSFYGGTLAALVDTLLIGDAVSPAGLGTVYLAKKRVPGLLVAGFENVLATAQATGNSSTSAMIFDIIATLSKSNTSSLYSGQDHFGKAIAIQNTTIAVGAPAEGCIYLYPDPVAYSVYKSGLVNIVTASTAEDEKTAFENSQQTKMHIIIGASIAAIVIVPAFVFFMIRRHKKRVLAGFQLK